MTNIDEILEDEGLDKGNLEAALELARLAAEETERGKFVNRYCSGYRRL